MTATQSSPPRDPKAPLPFSLLAEIAGWYGMLAILGAYTLATYKVLPAESPVLALMNLTGGLGVAWTCWRKRTWQAFWLEAIWSLVAIGALVRWLLA
jgi:hypothetical protein